MLHDFVYLGSCFFIWTTGGNVRYLMMVIDCQGKLKVSIQMWMKETQEVLQIYVFILTFPIEQVVTWEHSNLSPHNAHFSVQELSLWHRLQPVFWRDLHSCKVNQIAHTNTRDFKFKTM